MPQIGTVISDGLNLRDTPRMTGAVVDQLGKGEQVDVIRSEQDGWLYVEVHRTAQRGYVHGEYVSIAAQPAPKPVDVPSWPWIFGAIALAGLLFGALLL